MDDLSVLVQTWIDSEIDDLILDLVYELHSSLKGIPVDQLDLNQNGSKMKSLTVSSPSSTTQIQTIPIITITTVEKQTCSCPHCGQSNIVAIRFAYHLAKCLGVGRRSSRQAKHRIVDHIMTTAVALSDDSRSNGDDFHNGEGEDGSSCTDSTSSTTTLMTRRMADEDQEYTGDFDGDDDEEDDWKPKKKKRRVGITNQNGTTKKKKKNVLLVVPNSAPITELDFHNCIIPLDKLCPMTKHVMLSLSTPSTEKNIIFQTCNTSSSQPHVQSSLDDIVEETTPIIVFPEDNSER